MESEEVSNYGYGLLEVVEWNQKKFQVRVRVGVCWGRYVGIRRNFTPGLTLRIVVARNWNQKKFQIRARMDDTHKSRRWVGISRIFKLGLGFQSEKLSSSGGLEWGFVGEHMLKSEEI